MLDKNFWKRFEKGVNDMYYYAWWLFYTGCGLAIGSIIMILILSVQYIAIFNMKEMSRSYKSTPEELKKRFIDIVNEK